MTIAATSVRDALDSAVIALTAAGCDTPRLDAEVLLAAAMGVDRAALISDPLRSLSGPEARVFADYARRRREREPVAYITGVRGFRFLELLVDRRVLIPRPETEHVVEAALGLPAGARVVDVGTGSGAIALALKAERPDLDVVGTDISGEALDVARGNADRLNLDVSFIHGDLLAGLEADAVVSNPPYVDEGEALMPEIARYEPARGALRGAGRARGHPPAVRRAVRRGRARRGPGRRRRGARARGGLLGRSSTCATWPASSGCSLRDADARALGACVAAGGVAVFPADTVYGLACDPSDAAAVARLYELKGRPPEKPAAVMFFDLAAVPAVGPRTDALLARLLPGGVTLLLPNP